MKAEILEEDAVWLKDMVSISKKGTGSVLEQIQITPFRSDLLSCLRKSEKERES